MTELPAGWAWSTVAALSDLADGPFGSNLKTAHYTPSGPRVIRLQNIGSGFFRDERAHISEEHFARLLKYEAVAGDVIIASLGHDAPRACVVPAQLGPAIVKADCIRARPRLDARYLMWALNSPRVRFHATTMIKGVGRPRLGLRGIGQLAVPVAPLTEQRRIVAAIEEQFSRLDAAEALLSTAGNRLGRVSKSALRHSLGGPWPMATLDHIAEVRLGRQRSPKNHVGLNMRPYVRAANVTWAGLDLSDVKEMHFSPAEVSIYTLRDGDVLLSEASGSASEVGKPAVWREEIAGCCFQNTLIRVRSSGPLPEFLRLVFLDAALSGEFAEASPGIGIHHLGARRLAAWRLPLPPLEEQRRIVAEVERQLSIVDATRAAVDRALERSRQLRRSILERAFSGKLVPQDPDDEPASVLLERIRAERAADTPERPTRRGARMGVDAQT